MGDREFPKVDFKDGGGFVRNNGTDPEGDAKTLKEIEALVKETFELWDEKWVGFSWRHYYFNHTQRVRALSLEIGKKEGADLRKLEYAALLHDITKRYDGGIVTDEQGRRVMDDKGFWRNELILPSRGNIVTELYRSHDQFHKLHNVSGAFIAEKILDSYGFPDHFCTSVGSIIKAHLKSDILSPEEAEELYDNVESEILYDADTIDSNLGLVAFFRNIQIHTQRSGIADLGEYIEYIPRWLRMKEDFVGNIMTDTGREIAQERQRRNWEVYSQIVDEREDYQLNLRHGILGVIKYFMDCNEDPNLQQQMDYLRDQWIPERKHESDKESAGRSLNRVIDFYSLLQSEVKGKI